MDDDTSFVVGIIIIICIIAVIGYSIYSYFTSINPQAPSIWKFKSNTSAFTWVCMGLDRTMQWLMMDFLALESPYSECILGQY
jgi:hypothetical protein